MTWGHLGLTRWQRARLLQALVVVSLLHASALVRAQSLPHAGLGLNWVRLPGAESCIASVDLMNRIEERVGRIIFVRAGDAVLTIDGYVRPASSNGKGGKGTKRGWLVTFEMSDAEGTVLGRRELGMLEDNDCEVVAGAAELVVDLTLDSDGVLGGGGIPLEPETQRQLDELLRGEPSELDPATLPSAPHVAQAEPPIEPTPEPQPDPSSSEVARQERVALDLAGVATLGTLPALAPGLGLNLAFGAGRGWALELGLFTLAQQTVSAPMRDRGAVTLGYQALSLALCPPRFIPRVDLCGGAEYGRQAISVARFRSVREEVQSRELVNLMIQATARLDLFWSAFLHAHAALVVPLFRHEYVYDSRIGDQRLYRVPPVAARVELGLGLYI